jgi:hypothetical protein
VAAALSALAACLAGRRAGLPLALVGGLVYTLLVRAPPSAPRAALGWPGVHSSAGRLITRAVRRDYTAHAVERGTILTSWAPA